MKKSLVILIIFLYGNNIAFSQTFKAGAIAGLSVAQVEGDGYGGYNKLGFIVGGFVTTNLSEKFSAQFEIYYINKGSFDAAHPDKGDFDSFSLNLNYIEIPLALRYHHKKFKIELGLYYGKLLGFSVKNQFGTVPVNQYPFNGYDFGGLIGIEFQLNKHFSFNLRSKNSIIPIRNVPNNDIGILNTLFSNGWYSLDINFSVRYQFGNS